MKKVVCNMEENLAERVFRLASELGISRSELVRKALHEFIVSTREKRIAAMKNGYRQMARINLNLAEEALAGSEADLTSYEESLAEGESV